MDTQNNQDRNFRSTGSWRNRGSDKFEYRFMYIDEYGRKRQKSVSGETKEECYMKADRWLKKMEGLRKGDMEDATLVDLLERKFRMDFEMHYTGEQGYATNLANLKHLRKSSLGKIPVKDIGKDQILIYLRSITKYSDSTISKFYMHLKAGFRIAEEKGLIKRNPMKDSELRCPKSSKGKKEVHALTIDQQRRLVDHLSDKAYRFGSNDYRLQVMISLYSRLRMGEVNALHPEDVDLKKGVIHVRHTISKGLDKRCFVKDGTKTPSGVRDVPVSNALRPYLERALDECLDNKDGLLFYNFKQDMPITSDLVNSYFRRLCIRLDIPIYGQHCLRHTFATRCIESGIKPVVLKTWLGHRDIHTTLDTYTDVFNNLHDDSVGALDSYLTRI